MALDGANNMKTVQVKFSHVDDNGNPYYRTVPNEQLVCVIDGSWHTAVDDDCWQEPIGPINMDNVNIEVAA